MNRFSSSGMFPGAILAPKYCYNYCYISKLLLQLLLLLQIIATITATNKNYCYKYCYRPDLGTPSALSKMEGEPNFDFGNHFGCIEVISKPSKTEKSLFFLGEV